MIRRTPQSGFSLVETLVAITILLIVIVGPMTITSQTSRSSNFASEQVTAFFLAQEGIELVEKMRNDQQINHFLPTTHAAYDAQPWTLGFANVLSNVSGCYASTGCGLYITDSDEGVVSIVNCDPTTQCLLRENTNPNARSQFVHGGGGTGTKFTRVVKLTRENMNEVKVVSQVTWFSGNLRTSQDVTIETRLFNVYGN